MRSHLVALRYQDFGERSGIDMVAGRTMTSPTYPHPQSRFNWPGGRFWIAFSFQNVIGASHVGKRI